MIGTPLTCIYNVHYGFFFSVSIMNCCISQFTFDWFLCCWPWPLYSDILLPHIMFQRGGVSISLCLSIDTFCLEIFMKGCLLNIWKCILCTPVYLVKRKSRSFVVTFLYSLPGSSTHKFEEGRGVTMFICLFIHPLLGQLIGFT